MSLCSFSWFWDKISTNERFPAFRKKENKKTKQHVLSKKFVQRSNRSFSACSINHLFRYVNNSQAAKILFSQILAFNYSCRLFTCEPEKSVANINNVFVIPIKLFCSTIKWPKTQLEKVLSKDTFWKDKVKSWKSGGSRNKQTKQKNKKESR